VAAVAGFLAVALGAFGAHGLKETLEQHGTADIWQTAVLYQFFHSIMLFVLAGRDPLRRGPWFCFLLGIIIFSGTLYLLAVTNVRWLGAITPVGGISFLAGWLWLIVAPKTGRDQR
jgi:uncharacterized membrane protein YgdD (TMEM256/DUF423 family)